MSKQHWWGVSGDVLRPFIYVYYCGPTWHVVLAFALHLGTEREAR